VDEKSALLFMSNDTTSVGEVDSGYSEFTNDINGPLGGIDRTKATALSYDKEDGFWKLSSNVPKANASGDQAKSMVRFAPARGGRYVTQRNQPCKCRSG
jgi:hypothetical protein